VRCQTKSAELTRLIRDAQDELAKLPEDGPLRAPRGGPNHPTSDWPRRWEWFLLVEISRERLQPGQPRPVSEEWGTAFTRLGARWAARRALAVSTRAAT
jgi:hypothetical protein